MRKLSTWNSSENLELTQSQAAVLYILFDWMHWMSGSREAGLCWNQLGSIAKAIAFRMKSNEAPKGPRDQGSFKCWASVIRPSDESSRWLRRWVSSPVIHVPCKVPPLETRATGRQGVENRHWGPSVQPLGSTVFSLASLSSLAKNIFSLFTTERKEVLIF